MIRSDASGEDGWGACLGGYHFIGPWPVGLQDQHMLFKEMVPVTIVLALAAPALQETVFGVAVDNTGVAFALNKLECRDQDTLRLLQQITSDLGKYGHTGLGAHVRRHRNTHTDAMSHTLPKVWWKKIVREQSRRSKKFKKGYWFFPFVVQCLESGTCLSGVFRMRQSLFASLADKHI